MADLSLCELFGLSFARTGKNGDLIARAWRKKSVPIVVKVLVAAKSRQALLGKDTRSGQELLAPPYSSP